MKPSLKKKLKLARKTIRDQKKQIELLNDRVDWLRKDITDALDFVDAFIPSNYHEIVAELEALAQIYGSEQNGLHRKTT